MAISEKTGGGKKKEYYDTETGKYVSASSYVDKKLSEPLFKYYGRNMLYLLCKGTTDFSAPYKAGDPKVALEEDLRYGIDFHVISLDPKTGNVIKEKTIDLKTNYNTDNCFILQLRKDKKRKNDDEEEKSIYGSFLNKKTLKYSFFICSLSYE